MGVGSIFKTNNPSNPPVFSSGDSASTEENSGSGQVIYTAAAAIISEGEATTAEVTFALASDSDSVFSINQKTGEVSISIDPDFEVKGEYNFTVVASDIYGNKASQPVQLIITNVDDTAPTFISPDEITVDENNSIDQVVYTAAVDDSADVSEGSITFKLTETSDTVFSIDASSGEVSFLESADFESKSEYSFTVVATDGANNSSQKTVILTVNNLDDTLPTITSGATVSDIVEGSGENQVVYTAEGSDLGDGTDGSVTFKLSASSDTALSIDAVSGVVTLSDNPDAYSQQSYSFAVIAVDAAGNESNPQSLELKISEVLPTEAILAIVEDTGVAADGLTNKGEISVSNIKLGAKWEYSLDNGSTWTLGAQSSNVESDSFIISNDGSYEVVVRQTNSAGDSVTAVALNVIIDKVAPIAQQSTLDFDSNQITLVFNETLNNSFAPEASDFAITRNNESFSIQTIEVDGQSVILTIAEDITEGALQIAYTPSTSLMQDIAGNQVTVGFTQMIVSDGYIRDVKIYADTNNDGVADESELLEGVTTDSLGQVILSDDLGDVQIIISGGVNVDTGAINQLELTAPAGYTVINPLSTLVQEIVSLNGGQSVDEAEAVLSAALGITLTEGEDLSSYDPIADLSENAIANRVAVTQIATVLAVAAATDTADTSGNSNVQAVALENLVEIITESEEQITIDADIVAEILSDDQGSLVDVDALAVVTTSVETMEAVKKESENTQGEVDLEAVIADLIEAQAKAIDSVEPAQPDLQLTADSNSGISDTDLITNISNPTIKLSFDTQSTDGSAVIVGDTVQIFDAEALLETYKLQQADLDAGFYVTQLQDLSDGSKIAVTITDLAGNPSNASVEIEIDTAPLVISSSASAPAIDENSSTPQVIYTASVEDDDFWKFELSEDSDAGLSIDSTSGQVSLVVNPDFETQSEYSFTVVAFDKAGNTSEKSVTFDVNNIDDTAPSFTSPGTVAAIDENSGTSQVIYTATADDSADVSGGYDISLLGASDYAAPEVKAKTQHVYVSSASITGDGSQIEVKVGYLSQDTELTGLGLRVHFDSSKLSFADISGVLALDNLAQPNPTNDDDINADIENLDNDDNTDSFVNIGWASLFGKWPGAESADLATLVFDIAEGASSSVINFSVSSNAAGYAFEGAGQEINFFGSDPAVSFDATTGEVSLDSNPDFEAQEAYSFTLQATDAAGNSSIQVINLAINNLDEVSPTILSGETADRLVENSGAGLVIYTAVADDSADISAGITFSLAESSDSGLSIDSETGAVTLTVDPDYEVKDQYSFTVIASDGVNESATQTVTLAINDIDDTPPVITSGNPSSVTENTGAGQVVYTVTADDTGAVIIEDDTDSSQSPVSIPEQLTSTQHAYVSSSTKSEDGTQETIVISYKADVANTNGIGLRVHFDSSKLTLAEVSDVLALDNIGSPDLDGDDDLKADTDNLDNDANTDSFVNIAWASLFGSWPGTESAELATLVFDIAEDATGSSLINLTASSNAAGFGFDGQAHEIVIPEVSDIPDNAEAPVDATAITFELAEGSDESLSIDATTGEVTLAENPNYESKSEYSFTVIATDALGNSSDGDEFIIPVVNVDEIAPTITSSATANIDENSGAGQIVYTAIADDSADVSNGVTFSLTADSDAEFSINETTGEVTLLADTDFEAQSLYSFAVVATDAAGFSSDAHQVSLNINNLDEISPTITSGNQAITIDENSGASQVIYTAKSSDNADISGGVTYELGSGPAISSVSEPSQAMNTQHAYISSSTKSADGTQETVVISYKADSDSLTGLGLRVHFDSSKLSLAAVSDLLVQDITVTPTVDSAVVDNENEDNDSSTDSYVTVAWASLFGNWPGAESAELVTLKFDIAEDVSGASAINLTATSNAAGFTFDGQSHEVAISSEGSEVNPALSIDPFTGEVSLSVDPDHEAESDYSFSVVAVDEAGNVSEVESISVTINDLDEIAPTITSSSAVAVDENIGENQLIYTAIADDSLDVSAGLTFSLSEDSDPALSINASGEVTLATNPNADIGTHSLGDDSGQNQYSFTVIVSDGVNRAVEQSVTLDINNLDEIAPIVTSGNEAITLDENSGKDQVIYTATSTDTADISDGVSYILGSFAGEIVDSELLESAISIPEQATSTQHVYVSSSTKSEDGTQETVVISYKADDSTTTGLGLRVHFDSSQLSLSDISGVLSTDNLVTPTLDDINTDTDNLDNDVNTDSYVNIGWASLFGTWPGAESAELATLVFDIAEDATGSSAINLAASSNAAGFAFEGQAHEVAITVEDSVDSEDPVLSADLSIDSDTGEVSLTIDPDYEIETDYSFSVAAVDEAGNVSNVESVSVTINNLDDTGPRFTSANSVNSIDENSGAGQVIYDAAALDDLDVTSEDPVDLVFSLKEGHDSALSIDASSGKVTLATDPNADIGEHSGDNSGQNLYSFTVIVTDEIGNKTEQSLTLNINNLDEFDPTITSSNEAAVNENIGDNQVIYTVTSTDTADISGGVSYSLVEGEAGDVVSTEPPESTVSVPEQATSTQHVYVSSSTKSEDGTQETVVISYKADDSTTTGLGLRVHFDSSQLSLSDISGVLSTDNLVTPTLDDINTDTDNLDNDVNTDSYVNIGWASLFGTWPGAESAELATLVFDIAEDATGSSAINLAASSNAAGFAFDGQSHEVAISSGGSESESESVESQFSINAQTGEVSLSVDPDHETQAEYTFNVVATDEASNKSAVQAVTLNIIDLDDAAPTITSGAEAIDQNDIQDELGNITEEIVNDLDENTGAGQIVYIATADDSGDNIQASPITFSLAVGSDSALSIQTVTVDENHSLYDSENPDPYEVGEVTLISDPDHEVQAQYSFGIIATDAVGNKSAEQSVTLDINDIDDTAPYFLSESNATVVDNSTAAQVVFTAVVDDTADVSEGVTFSLLQGTNLDSALEIDPVSGKVTLNEQPDFETKPQYFFTVLAEDGSGQGVVQHVTLTVTNVDDSAPTFDSSDEVSVDENIGVDQVIYKAVADDSGDTISAGVTFELKEDSDPALSINAATGEVTLSDNPNYEAQDQYSFTVLASDGVNLDVEQSVTLDINDLDEAAPTITSESVADAIDENSVANQVVYTAIATDDSVEVIYSLENDFDGVLSIDEHSGEVRLTVTPDYETQAEYSFVVIAKDQSGNTSSQSITMAIGNLDEIAPTIDSLSIAFANENIGPNQVVYTATADDSADISDGVSFYLTADSDAALSMESSTGKVTLADSPNADTGVHSGDSTGKSQYSFGVYAVDANNHEGEVKNVTLNINNLDEFAPTFIPAIDGDLEQVLILDSTEYGDIIYQAETDDSADVSSGVTYSLSGTDADLFDITPSGQLSLRDDLVEGGQASFSLVIDASDGANSTAREIQVAVVNVDNDAPIINSVNAVAIDENSPAGTVIYTATTDATLEESAVSFSLDDNNDGELSIDNSTGEVTLNNLANFEDYPEYSFNIIAVDAAGNQGEPHAVTVTVNNLDEIAPIITSGDSADQVDENTGAEQIIYDADATDAEVVSGDITFALAVDDQGFSIDANSGVVTTNTEFTADYEISQTQSFTVTATDAAGNATHKVVSLAIINVDDTAPTITSGESAIAIAENSGADQIVYSATAEDAEGDMPSGDITFSLGNSDLGFSIDEESGVVTTNDAFLADFEENQTQSFTVIARDAEGNESSVHSVTLAINNIDEVAPTITSGDSATVLGSLGEGALVYRAIADDSADVSSSVAFSLSEESDSAITIHPLSGDVTLNEAPDFDVKPSYSFTVIANDGIYTDEKQVTLDVINDDADAPVFTSLSTATVDENSGEDQVIYTATTTDASLVDYSLADGHDADLSINALTGQVSLDISPDHESKSAYNFTVIAEDSANNASQQSVIVSINNLDDSAPSITSSDTAVAINENTGVDQVIYTAKADDAGDDVADAPITFSLAAGSDAGLSIDGSSGVVTLTANPNYEVQPEYSFGVIATDAAGNASEVQSVSLSITNLDDAAPTITSGGTATDIDENSGASQLVYTVSADDSADISDGIVYSMVNDAGGNFSFNAETREVTLLIDPNSEGQNQYSFTVFATDAAGNESAGQLVTLDINNIDEVAPTFESLTLAIVAENIEVDSGVYRAQVDDSGDISAGITFSLKETSDAALVIDENTGLVTITESPNYEIRSSYSFTVVASDGVNANVEQLVALQITNLDESDPIITSAETADAIDENSGVSQVIYKVTSDDSADVSYGVTYSLVDNLEEALSIDTNTGEVTLAANPDADTLNLYSFTVVATDAAGNQKQKDVTLGINDLDDAAPTLTSPDTAEAINENSGAGQVIYTAKAEDSNDDIVDGPIAFSLVSDLAGALSINATTGEVTLNVNPNHEAQTQYTFEVVATDAAGNASDPQSVSLVIDDLDDAAPTITSLAIADDLTENTGENQIIYTVTADDSGDDVAEAPITYSLVDDLEGALSIDPATGAVRLTVDPLYYDQPNYLFEVVATDAASNSSDPFAVELNILETLPAEASVSLAEDTGVAADNISSNGEIIVSGLKLGATWQYSLDDGATWYPGTGSTFTIVSEGVHQVKVKQTNTAGTSEMADAYEITFDASAPIVQFVSADSDPAVQTISVSYTEDLDPAYLPAGSDYSIEQNGNPLTVSSVALDAENASILVLSINEAFNAGALSFTYTASDNTSELVTDLAGNQLDQGFTQMIVSDGYIRGAQVYVDANKNGIAEESELREEVTSDAFGQIILTDEFLNASENNDAEGNPYQVIIKGGVNMDSGAPNEIELTAPAGYSVINPLSTLVQEIASSEAFEGMSAEQAAVAAETSLAESLGIDLGEGGLGSYDPQSDDNVENRVIATQIATVLAVASAADSNSTDSEGSETAALAGLANKITSSEGQSVNLDSSTMSEVLGDVGLDEDQLATINQAVDAMEEVKGSTDLDAAFATIVQAQATAIDTVKPEAPEVELTAASNSGFSNTDKLTNVTEPVVRIVFDTLSDDGSAVIVGDVVKVFNTGTLVETFNLDADDISRGYVDYEWSQSSLLTDGKKLVSASVTDLAGNESYVSTFIFDVDTQALVINSGDFSDPVNENTGAEQVIYTATVEGEDFWKFELGEGSDEALTIDHESGEVVLSTNPDHETQSEYSFTVVAFDNAGNESSRSVTLDINDLDEIAPTITSATSADTIDENTGAGQVIYTATADDSQDISAGVTFSLTAGSDAALSIDSLTGDVTLDSDSDFEAQAEYSFTVVASDGVNANVEQSVTLDINNLDEVAPTITSGDKADAIDENSGAGQVIYSATADDSGDISDGFTFSLGDGSDSALSIDSATGEVTLATDPDHEVQSQYSFSVIATDAANHASDAKAVTLDINDLDDAAPTITSGETAPAINENSGAGQVIYQALADDGEDDIAKEPVTFSFAEGSDPALTIDATYR
jgi:hypothetical protein